MPCTRRRWLAAAGLLGLARWTSAPAQSEWPARPIRLISPFVAGGVADIFNRIMAERLSPRLGQPVVVDTKPGASTMIAIDALAKSPPDGYSFAITTMSSTVNNRVLFAKMPYDPVKDLQPVTQVAYAQLILVAPAAAAYDDLQGFVRFARAAGRPISYGSWGNGSGAHVCGFLLARETGLNLLHVPYKGEGPALIDVKGGQLDTSWTSVSSVKPYLADGSLKLIAITGNERSRAAPQVGTFKEQGVAGFDLALWAGAYLPAGTPAPIVGRFQREIAAVLREPETAAKVRGLGWDPLGNGTDEFIRNYEADYPKWRALMQAAGVKAE